MKIRQVLLPECGSEQGTVVAIDVVRAFTTAAYAFQAGADSIYLTAGVEEARQLRSEIPGALLMGEVDGLPIPGFDFSNSPAALLGADLRGRTLIQRTSAGTQGVVRSTRAGALMAASLCCAAATARYLLANQTEEVAFVITGSHTADRGAEDAACAELIEALLRGETPSAQTAVEKVYRSEAARKFLNRSHPAFDPRDLELCCAVDRFDFAMPVTRVDGRLVMRPA